MRVKRFSSVDAVLCGFPRNCANFSLLVLLCCAGLTCASGSTILSPVIGTTSSVCGGSDCQSAAHNGNPASSSISRGFAIPGFVGLGVNSGMTIDEGLWRGEASVGGFINKSGQGAVAYSGKTAGAVFDNLMIPVGAFLVLPIHVTGSVVAEASAPSNLPQGTTFGASVTLGFTCQVNGFENGQYLPGSSCAPQQLNFTSDQAVDQIIQLTIPFVAGQEFTLGFGPSITANLGMGSTASSGPFFLSGRAAGDFLNTGVLEAAQVLDANGNLLSNVPIVAESGFNFNSPPGEPGSPVPEPRTEFLLAGALGLLALLRNSKFGKRYRSLP